MNNRDTGRVQTNLNLGVDQFRPAARVVDTFVNPGRVQPVADDTMAKSLVEALAQGDQKLTRFLDRQHAEQVDDQNKDDVAQGDRLGMVSKDISTWQEAIDKGVVDPTASKWVRKGFMEARGRVMGFGYQEQLNALYADWDGKNDIKFVTDAAGNKTVDDSGFMGFLQQQREQALRALPNDPDLFRSFSSQMAQIEQNVMGEHRRFVQDKMKDDILQTHYQELSGALKIAQQNGDYNGALDVINAVNGSARFTRMLSGAEINDATVKAITTEAKTMASSGYAGDAMKLLDLASQERPDGTKGPGRTARGQLQIEEAREHVSTIQMRSDEQNYRKQERDRKEAAETAMREVMTNLIRNAEWQPPQSLLIAGTSADPEFVHKVQAMQNGFRMSADRDDPRHRTELARLVYTRSIDVNSIASFPGVSSATKQQLMQDASRVENSSLATDPIATRAVSSMSKAIFDPLTSKGFGQDAYDSQSAEALAYETILHEEEAWRGANPGKSMTPVQKLELVNKVTKAITESYRSDADAAGENNPALAGARANLAEIRRDAKERAETIDEAELRAIYGHRTTGNPAIDRNSMPIGELRKLYEKQLTDAAVVNSRPEWADKPLFKSHEELRNIVQDAVNLSKKGGRNRLMDLFDQYGLKTPKDRNAFIEAQAKLLRGK